MRVVLVGGVAKSLVNFRGSLVQELLSAGHEVVGMAPGEDSEYAAILSSWGASYKSTSFMRSSLNPLVDLRASNRLAHDLREMKADAVMSYTIRMAIWGTIAAKKAGIPLRSALITGMGASFETGGLKGRILRSAAVFLTRMSLSKATAVIVQNPDDAQLLAEVGAVSRDQVKIVNGSGVDLDHFTAKPLPQGPVSFLMVARLLIQKGVREYFEAARRVKALRPDVQFHLVGPVEEHVTGISAKEVEQLVAEGIVIYHGSQKDVRPFFEACHIYTLPSYYPEGTPRSILEALATGRAIITTDMPGCRATITHGVEGFLVPKQDPEALTKAMMTLIDDPEMMKAMAQKARQRAEDVYDVRKVNGEMMKHMGLSPTK